MSNAEMYDLLFKWLVVLLGIGAAAFFIHWVNERPATKKNKKEEYVNLLEDRSDGDDVNVRTRRKL